MNTLWQPPAPYSIASRAWLTNLASLLVRTQTNCSRSYYRNLRPALELREGSACLRGVSAAGPRGEYKEITLQRNASIGLRQHRRLVAQLQPNPFACGLHMLKLKQYLKQFTSSPGITGTPTVTSHSRKSSFKGIVPMKIKKDYVPSSSFFLSYPPAALQFPA